MLVTSDAHAGLVEAIAANLPGATWQRCRTHYAANLMDVCPKSAWGAVKALLHSVYDQPDTKAVHAQYDKMLDTLTGKLPAVVTTSTPLVGRGLGYVLRTGTSSVLYASAVMATTRTVYDWTWT